MEKQLLELLELTKKLERNTKVLQLEISDLVRH